MRGLISPEEVRHMRIRFMNLLAGDHDWPDTHFQVLDPSKFGCQYIFSCGVTIRNPLYFRLYIMFYVRKEDLKLRNRFIVWSILIGLGILSLSPRTVAQPSEGKLAFSIRKPRPTVDGFKAAAGLLEQQRGGKKLANWERFYEYNICTLNPDGTDLRQLTVDGVSRRPKWSPDGTHIAYIAGSRHSQSLYVMTESGEEKTELLKRQLYIHDFWWSPDNQAILVAVEAKRTVDPKGWIVTVDGESQKRLHSKWPIGWFHWDARGKKVENPKSKLIQALPDGVSWPKWSPDHRYIAFVTKRSRVGLLLSLADVETTGITGKWFHQKNEPPCVEIGERSLDGKRILFYLSGNVCAATVLKGKIEAVVKMGYGRDATWSPDGSRVAFVGKNHENQARVHFYSDGFVFGNSSTGGADIYLMDVESGHATQLTYTNYSHFDLDWR